MRKTAITLPRFSSLLNIFYYWPVMRIAVMVLLLVGFVGCAHKPEINVNPNPDARISYYSSKVSNQPRLYPAYALLGSAYLDKARETSDPAWLAKARASLNRSIDIQPNFEAFKTMAALCNFAHRFEEALKWGKRASEAYPIDTGVIALLVEAHMGLGQYEEARKILSPSNKTPEDFYTTVALGNWLASQQRSDEAANAFQKAVAFARAAGVRELVLWAEVSTAGVFIDSHKPEMARVYLEKATLLDSRDLRLRLHLAELLIDEDKWKEALAVYNALLKERDHPEIHRKAFSLARKLGQQSNAQFHFDAAEKGFQHPIELGEIYTLGALAQLYCDAEVNLQKALALAQQNLKYKRDREAQETLVCIHQKLQKP